MDHIGELFGERVMLDRDSKTIVIEGDVPLRFSIDHPYIQGTKIETWARAMLADSSRAPEKKP